MKEHHAIIDQERETYERNAYKRGTCYKMRKGLDNGNHAIIQAISYAEYHTNKLNGQRPFDRPYGNAERTTYRKGTRASNTLTYSEKTAREWYKGGAQVFEYNARGVLVQVFNPTPETKAFFANSKKRPWYVYL